eukprot:768775-Hanusia_phi.AAC.1
MDCVPSSPASLQLYFSGSCSRQTTKRKAVKHICREIDCDVRCSPSLPRCFQTAVPHQWSELDGKDSEDLLAEQGHWHSQSRGSHLAGSSDYSNSGIKTRSNEFVSGAHQFHVGIFFAKDQMSQHIIILFLRFQPPLTEIKLISQ